MAKTKKEQIVGSILIFIYCFQTLKASPPVNARDAAEPHDADMPDRPEPQPEASGTSASGDSKSSEGNDESGPPPDGAYGGGDDGAEAVDGVGRTEPDDQKKGHQRRSMRERWRQGQAINHGLGDSGLNQPTANNGPGPPSDPLAVHSAMAGVSSASGTNSTAAHAPARPPNAANPDTSQLPPDPLNEQSQPGAVSQPGPAVHSSSGGPGATASASGSSQQVQDPVLGIFVRNEAILVDSLDGQQAQPYGDHNLHPEPYQNALSMRCGLQIQQPWMEYNPEEYIDLAQQSRLRAVRHCRGIPWNIQPQPEVSPVVDLRQARRDRYESFLRRVYNWLMVDVSCFALLRRRLHCSQPGSCFRDRQALYNFPVHRWLAIMALLHLLNFLTQWW